MTDTLGSDLFPIIMDWSETYPHREDKVKPKTKWNTTKANWSEYEKQCPNFQTCDEKYEYFINGINMAAQNARKHALVRYQQYSTEENFMFSKRKMAHTKKILKLKAKSHWIKWCSNLNKNTPCAELWNQSRKMKRIPIRAQKCENYKWVEPFLEKVTPSSVTNGTTEIFEELNNDNTNDIFDYPITINELLFCLTKTTNSAPGLDTLI
ncbi:hypothetical protein JTB14_017563 [Gonioctena quinquepunctata]|nr:hypothetical protein JTB14_017563 [Gonioctena quinquepunctata]